MPEPIENPPRRRPRRCVAMHPFVDEGTHVFLQARADAHYCAAEQLAGYILDRVRGDPQLQRLLKI